jgi:ketosteroid isomerase-like protein
MTDELAMEEAVVTANDRFYRAFESLDIKEMEEVWSTDGSVQCIHPGWGLLSGWADVRDSWVRIFNNTSAMSFTPHVLHVSVEGPIAWVVCLEDIDTRHGDTEHNSQVLATNVFKRVDDRWLLVHHHTSPIFRATESEGNE